MDLTCESPTRVIILSKSSKSNEEIIKAFLRHSSRPEDEYERNLHFFHLDPDRTSGKWSHIVIDIDSTEEELDLNSLHHEIYKTSSADDSL